ncbi:MAG: TolC family protein [Gemmatimonadetes bacterium]|nr:TolC family protein [Gemmatimonadota bacterium]
MMTAFAVLMQVVVADTAVLSFAEFQRRVATAHPIVRQARLLDTLAMGRERAARGAFDPRVSAQWDRKALAGKAYFDYLDVQLSIPTQVGVDVKVGFERARGPFAAPDRGTPGGGLLTAGVSLPIGQRLVTDERRVALAQARAIRDVAAGERDALVNKLFSTAADAYAAWYEGHQRVLLAEEGVRLAAIRQVALRARVEQGDAAAIDTIEAGLEVSRRQLARREAMLSLQNAGVFVESLLWDDRAQPMQLADNLRPGGAELASVLAGRVDAPEVLAAAREHPELRKALAKVREQDAVRRLALQRAVTPDVSATLTSLAEPGDALGSVTADAKAGVGANVPLLWRKERGTLQASTARLDQLASERAVVARGVTIAIQVALNEWRALEELLSMQREVVEQARRLREGEDRKFAAGESTVFLVTARERLVLDEEVKRIALEAKRFTALGKLTVALGRPAS